jgi:hypothetical protein
MKTHKTFYKAHLRRKKQFTIERPRIIPSDQAWFWTEHWQQMEREAQVEIDAGNVLSFDNVQVALKYLHDASKDEVILL